MNGETPISGRKNNFDILRLFAALLVIYGHSYPILGLREPDFAMNGVAKIAVKIFFIISGYLIAKSWMSDPSIGRYILRRIVRIMPALIVIVILSSFLLGPILTTLPLEVYFHHPFPYDYLYNIALYIHYNLPGVFSSNPYPYAVNGSLWSLPAEFSMYLCAPVIISLALISRVPRVAVVVLSIFISAASLYLNTIVPRQGQIVFYLTDLWSCLWLAPYFAIGLTYAVCRADRVFNIYAAFLLLFGLAMCAMSAGATEAALMVILPYSVLTFGLGYAPVFTKLTKHGDLSYGVYLYGWPMQQLMAKWFGTQIGPWLNFAGAAVLSLICAYASWHIIEKTALRLKVYRPKRMLVAQNEATISVPSVSG